jgi:hypothetical protein
VFLKPTLPDRSASRSSAKSSTTWVSSGEDEVPTVVGQCPAVITVEAHCQHPAYASTRVVCCWSSMPDRHVARRVPQRPYAGQKVIWPVASFRAVSYSSSPGEFDRSSRLEEAPGQLGASSISGVVVRTHRGKKRRV